MNVQEGGLATLRQGIADHSMGRTRSERTSSYPLDENPNDAVPVGHRILRGVPVIVWMKKR